MSGFGHLFKNHKAYSAFRPTYPADLYEHIYRFADLQRYDLAVDIATGSGQAATVLAKRFQKVLRRISIDRLTKLCTDAQLAPSNEAVLRLSSAQVIAQDQSENQLQGAVRDQHNIEYQHAKAEETGLPNACADLVTTAQAMHW